MNEVDTVISNRCIQSMKKKELLKKSVFFLPCGHKRRENQGNDKMGQRN